jgi:plastocyanin
MMHNDAKSNPAQCSPHTPCAELRHTECAGYIAAAALLLTVVTLPGCGGGASATPTVTYLPTDVSAAAASGSAAAPSTTEVAAAGFGTLKGKVVFQGEFKPLPAQYAKGAAPKDPTVCGVEAVPNEDVVVNDGGLANVFIYLAKAPKGEFAAAPTEPVVFDQKYCVFKPHALIARIGQPVQILNSDAALHNTHTYPQRNTSFNQGVQPNDQVGVSLKYTKAESKPLMVGCDVHPWMKAYHLPVDHPFAAVSGPDGTFEIKDLPSGKHDFKVWHEKGGELQKALSVTIKADETTEIDIPVTAAKLGL